MSMKFPAFFPPKTHFCGLNIYISLYCIIKSRPFCAKSRTFSPFAAISIRLDTYVMNSDSKEGFA